MNKNRLEAIFDSVVAIIITIMVLEIKAPNGDSLSDLTPLIPVILSYILSFIYLGIYWNNHHHMLYTCHKVTGSMLWANLYLLFWLSIIPFTTGWMGENHFATLPTTAYGFVLLMAAIAYYILQQRIIVSQGKDSILKKAIGNDWKGKFSPALYFIGMVLAFAFSWFAITIYAIVALIWLIPDKRIERVLINAEE